MEPVTRVLDRVPDSVVGDERLSIAANWSAGMLEVPGKQREASLAERTAQAAASVAFH